MIYLLAFVLLIFLTEWLFKNFLFSGPFFPMKFFFFLLIYMSSLGLPSWLNGTKPTCNLGDASLFPLEDSL